MARTTLRSQFSEQERKDFGPRIVDRNTFRYKVGDETVTRLHSTDIVRQQPDGSVILISGGYKTSTTKDRMNGALPAGFSIYQERGIWYVRRHNDSRAVPFYDGMQVPQCFAEPAEIGEEAKKQDSLLRKQIAAFVKKLDTTDVPVPSLGDCLYCQIETQEGKSLGDASGDVSHLRSHVEEGYLHGSLVLRALQWAGYRFPGVVFHHKGIAKRALRRYLQAKLGLAS